MTSQPVSPAVEVPENLRGLVSTTFTHACVWGCTIHVVETVEQPHDCAGVAAVLETVPHTMGCHAHRQAGGECVCAERRRARAQLVVDVLAPLVRERAADAWVTGVRDGRGGGLFHGVPEDEEAIAAEGGRGGVPLTFRADAGTAESADGGACEVCGCTDARACPGGCSWIRPGLCSACVPRHHGATSTGFGSLL